jgi:hypothetical protein
MPPQLPFINDSCLIPLTTKLGYFFFNEISLSTTLLRLSPHDDDNLDVQNQVLFDGRAMDI